MSTKQSYLQNGSAIRAIRQRTGVGQTVLAGRVGCHVQTLRNIEKDRKPASPELLSRIARELDVELAAITNALVAQAR